MTREQNYSDKPTYFARYHEASRAARCWNDSPACLSDFTYCTIAPRKDMFIVIVCNENDDSIGVL